MPEVVLPGRWSPLDPTDHGAQSPEGGQGLGSPPWAALLELFYERSGWPLPHLVQLKNDEVPRPYHDLLVHSSDMTPTLERFYSEPMLLTVLSREVREDSYLREVTLDLGSQARPVEYGAIRIWLDHLPPSCRHKVLQERSPFGKILLTEAVPHLSWPQAFFRADPDSHMSGMLRLPETCVLYGRRNVLVDKNRRLLAEVIEVLAPVPAPGTGTTTPEAHKNH